MFVRRDHEILIKHFEVTEIRVPEKIIQWPIYYRHISKAMRHCDVFFSWFANWHSLIGVHHSQRLGKRSVIVAGGYDVANCPEIGYGAVLNLKERYPSKKVLENADLILSVSRANQEQLLERATPKGHELIYNGIPEYDVSDIEKENMVITVGAVNWNNLKRKGLDTFVLSAKYHPSIPFVLIGRWCDDSIDRLRSIAPPNVIFTDYVTERELKDFYKQAKVYVQASYHESFGVSLAEAMMCQCIPVVSFRYALPEVVGNAGYYVHGLSPKELAEQIQNALRGAKTGEGARKHILNNFTLAHREDKLVSAIKRVMG